jgi:hypothetical protein
MKNIYYPQITSCPLSSKCCFITGFWRSEIGL